MNMKSEASFSVDSKGKFSESKNGMVTSAFPEATNAGVEILKKNGNAIDAAVACALALGVCEPQSSGLGGQTMMLIKNEKKTIALDGSSRAPSLAHLSVIQKDDKLTGYRASTVPSTPATLAYAHKRYGVLSWSDVIAPAINLAENGYPITELQSTLQQRELKNFDNVLSGSGKKYFLKNGVPYQPGDIFKQPELAKLLKLLSDKGVQEFYTGKTAELIGNDMKEHGGLLRSDDLALIPWPIQRKPLKRKFRGYEIQTMPPPGAGRTLLFTLMMLDLIPSDVLHSNIETRYHILSEVFRQALLHRSDRPYDPNFYPQVSEKMLRSSYAKKIIRTILKKVDKTLLPVIETDDEKAGDTTHLSVIDKNGLAVSLTQSIERVYGSKAAAEGLGFLYNNYLYDYEFKDMTHPYYLRPNAVPWATVAPTFVFNNDKIWMALGSPGSERIFSALSQFLINIIDSDMSMDKAMYEPRMHCSLGGRVSIEDRFDDSLYAFLKSKGYRIDKREEYAFYLGAIHAVIMKQDGSGFQGAAEIRRDGTAGGPK